MPTARTQKLFRTFYNRIVAKRKLQESDVLLASFPKSGNTWVRFIWANMVSLLDLDGRIVDYELLNERMVAEYDSMSFGDMQYGSLPRLVKTHRPYDRRQFSRHRGIYLMRHPGDTMVSYYEYRRHFRNPEKRPDGFKAFIRDSDVGLPAWCEHVTSWAEVATTVVTYEALWADAFGTMKTAMDKLGIDPVPDHVLQTAVERSDFRQVRSLEESEGLDENARSQLREDFRFARRGEPDQWREYFDDEDMSYLQDLCRQYDMAWILGEYKLLDGLTMRKGNES